MCLRRVLKAQRIHNRDEVRLNKHRVNPNIGPGHGLTEEVVLQICHPLDLIALECLIELKEINEAALDLVLRWQEKGLGQAAIANFDRKVQTILVDVVETEPL